MLPQNIFKNCVEIRVESMSDFVANHLICSEGSKRKFCKTK